MTELLQSLIDTPDNIEIIRDQIAFLLLAEVENQKSLATAAAKDPTLWDLEIYLERHNPWEKWQNSNDPSESENRIPLVNISVDSDSNIDSASNSVSRKYTPTRYNIDCYAQGRSKDSAGGHTPGDMDAAFESQRAMRLVRRILMAGQNNNLQLTYAAENGKALNLVGKRNVLSRTCYQPQQGDQNVFNLFASRIVFEVSYNEFAQEYEGLELELLSSKMFRKEDGQVLLEADFDYT